MADIETSVAVTAQTDDLQSGMRQAADAVAAATASISTQLSTLGSAAQTAQEQISAAAGQIESSLAALQARAAGLAGSVGSAMGQFAGVTGGGAPFPGLSVTAATGEMLDTLAQQSELEQDYYERKQAAALEDAKFQEDLTQQQQDAYTDYLAKRETLDAEAVQSSNRQWQTLLTPIQRSLDRSITGLITGTTTPQRALSNLEGAAIGDIVKAGVGAGFSGLGGLLGGSLFGGGDDQDFSGGIAGAGADFLGGGVFGELFKGIGSIFGFERGGVVPSAQAGWAVPQLGPGGVLAQLHSNEMVLPAEISQGLQSMIAGGAAAPNVTFAVSAMDSQSVASFFRNNGSALVAAINRAVRNGSPLVGMAI